MGFKRFLAILATVGTRDFSLAKLGEYISYGRSDEKLTYNRRSETTNCKARTETIEYQLSEEAQICPYCAGKLHGMSTEVRRELKIVPAEVKVVAHVRHVYACRRCEQEATSTPIITAPMPTPVMP